MPKKIFFVEDDEGFYNIFSVPLKMKGYDIVRVSEGSSAVMPPTSPTTFSSFIGDLQGWLT